MAPCHGLLAEHAKSRLLPYRFARRVESVDFNIGMFHALRPSDRAFLKA